MNRTRDLPPKARVLVLGGSGLVGRAVCRQLAARFEVTATFRSEARARLALESVRAVTDVTADEPASIDRALDETRPDVVVNCIGLVKQRPSAADPAALIRINSLLPHTVATACAARDIRLIHISTDCVFSGRRGGYTEDDLPDPVDLYGRSKLAGEPSGPGVLTLRTSVIGHEDGQAFGLLEWFRAADAPVRGFTRAFFSGPTAPVLARAIGSVIEHRPALTGTRHIGADPISKYDLLGMIRDEFGLQTAIEPDETVVIDRSLDSSRLRDEIGWVAPDWRTMVHELAEEASSPSMVGAEDA